MIACVPSTLSLVSRGYLNKFPVALQLRVGVSSSQSVHHLQYSVHTSSEEQFLRQAKFARSFAPPLTQHEPHNNSTTAVLIGTCGAPLPRKR